MLKFDQVIQKLMDTLKAFSMKNVLIMKKQNINVEVWVQVPVQTRYGHYIRLPVSAIDRKVAAIQT